MSDVKLGHSGTALYDSCLCGVTNPPFTMHAVCCRHSEMMLRSMSVCACVVTYNYQLYPAFSHSILGVISLVYITVVMIVKYFIFLANDSVYECSRPRSIPS